MNSNKQLNLFNDDNSTNISKSDLEIDYIKNCFNKSESLKLFESLKENIDWKQDFIKMFGKSHPLPRLTAWYGDEKKTYTYSGIPMTPMPWTRDLLEVKNKIEVY